MTDGRHPTPGCLDAETLAAFMDGRLTPSEREDVEAHLADCEECYEVWREATAAGNDATATARETTTVPNTWPRRRLITIAATLVATLGGGALVLQLLLQDRPPAALGVLVREAGTARISPGRTSEQFPWRPPTSPTRGTTPRRLSLEADAAVIELLRIARDRPSVQRLRAAGLAHLVNDEPDEAVRVLSSAVDLGGGADVLVDLSSAYLQLALTTGDRVSYAGLALDAAQRALVIDAVRAPARFNKALALTYIGLRADAVSAWDEYLLVDSTSEWATEARGYLETVKSPQAFESPFEAVAAAYRYLELEALPAWANTGAPLPAAAIDAADVLRNAGTGRWLPNVVAATSDPSASHDCLRRGILALTRWREAFEAGGYERTLAESRAATDGLECAGLTATRPRLLEALLELSRGETEGPVVEAVRLGRDSAARGDWRDVALAEQIQGTAALQATRLSLAVSHQTQAFEAARRSGDPEMILVVGANKITALANEGHVESAWQAVAELAPLMAVVESPRRRYQLLARTTALAERQGLWGTALALSHSVLAIAHYESLDWMTVAGQLQRARALHALGSSDEAFAALEAADLAAQTLFDEEFRSEARAEVALTSGRLLMTDRPADAAAALKTGRVFLEQRGNRTRTMTLLLLEGQALMSAGQPDAARRVWEEGVALLEDQRTSIRAEQLRIARTSAAWDLFDELVLSERHAPAAALAVLERGHARELLDSMSPTQTLVSGDAAVRELRWLPETLQIVSYFVARDRLLIWTISRRGVAMHERLIRASALATLVERHRQALESGRTDDLELVTTVLPPDLVFNAADPIAFIPDGPLHGVAFGALTTPRSSPLITEAIVVNVPSLEVLRHLLARPARPEGHTLVVDSGQAGSAEGLLPLRWTAAEASAIRRWYPDLRLLSNDEATRDRVLAAAQGAAVVSFAGHAVVDATRPVESFLAVAPTPTEAGRITPPDIASVRLADGAFVVLGACGTAAGQVFRGEGSLSIARPFLMAGAAAVVATLWDVPDRESHDLVTRLHERFAAGDTAALALAVAQRHAHALGLPPSSWAGFTVIGRP